MTADVLGVDVGGVIISRSDADEADEDDTSFFGDNYLETPPVEGVFAALAGLVDGRFGDGVHVVSKCGPKVQARTLEWMEHHSFADRTGIPMSHVHFCRERREKGPICARLGVSHFVDDRLDVLRYLTTVPHRYLLGHPRGEVPDGVRVVASWAEIVGDLL